MSELSNSKSKFLFDNLKVVNHFLRKNGVKETQFNDYYSDIYIIIDRSFDTIDLEKYNVEQYLYNFVREAVGQHRLADQGIRVPRDKRLLAWKVMKTLEQSLKDNGVADGFDEVADKFGLSTGEVLDLYALAFIDSIDRQVGDDEDAPRLSDTLEVAVEDDSEALDAIRTAIRRCCAYLLNRGEVKAEDVRCFLALYSPEDVREGWRELDELLEVMGGAYKSTQALGYHIRNVRDALVADIFETGAHGEQRIREDSVCYRLLGGFAKGHNLAA